MKATNSCGIHSSHKNFTISRSFSNSSFISRFIGLKFSTKNDKMSTIKLELLKSDF